MFSETKTQNRRPVPPEKLDEIFGDFEARKNLVGLFALLLKVDQRHNPDLYRAAPARTVYPDHD